MDIFIYIVLEFIPTCRIRVIHFHFQLVEKFEHVQTFKLTEISFRFIENVNLVVNILLNLLISTN